MLLRECEAGAAGGRVLSVYPATEGLSFKVIRQLIDKHIDDYLPLYVEHLPDWLLQDAEVPALPEALRRPLSCWICAFSACSLTGSGGAGGAPRRCSANWRR